MTLDPQYPGLPPVAAVAEHARLHPCDGGGMWLVKPLHDHPELMPLDVIQYHEDAPYVDSPNGDLEFESNHYSQATYTPCRPNGWPVAAVSPESHVAAAPELGEPITNETLGAVVKLHQHIEELEASRAAAVEAAYREGRRMRRVSMSPDPMEDSEWDRSNARAALHHLPDAGNMVQWPDPADLGGAWRGDSESESAMNAVAVAPFYETVIKMMSRAMHQCRANRWDFAELLRQAAALHRQERDAGGGMSTPKNGVLPWTISGAIWTR